MSKPVISREVTADANGTKFTLNIDVLDDVELLDELHQLNTGNPTVVLSVVRRIFGADTPQVLDAIRDDSGKVRVEAVGKLIESIFEGVAPNS